MPANACRKHRGPPPNRNAEGTPDPENRSARHLLSKMPGEYLAATYSHRAYRPTTIGAAAFHFRVRNGTGWFRRAMTTRGGASRLNSKFRMSRCRNRTGPTRETETPPLSAMVLSCVVLCPVAVPGRFQLFSFYPAPRSLTSTWRLMKVFLFPLRRVVFLAHSWHWFSGASPHLEDTRFRPREKRRNQAIRMISTARLHTLLRFDLRPINVVVSHDPSGKTHLGNCLALRCFQRLSVPHLATRPCR